MKTSEKPIWGCGLNTCIYNTHIQNVTFSGSDGSLYNNTSHNIA